MTPPGFTTIQIHDAALSEPVKRGLRKLLVEAGIFASAVRITDPHLLERRRREESYARQAFGLETLWIGEDYETVSIRGALQFGDILVGPISKTCESVALILEIRAVLSMA